MGLFRGSTSQSLCLPLLWQIQMAGVAQKAGLGFSWLWSWELVGSSPVKVGLWVGREDLQSKVRE